MPMTITEKILASHVDQDEISPGEFIEARVDTYLTVNEIRYTHEGPSRLDLIHNFLSEIRNVRVCQTRVAIPAVIRPIVIDHSI